MWRGKKERKGSETLPLILVAHERRERNEPASAIACRLGDILNSRIGELFRAGLVRVPCEDGNQVPRLADAVNEVRGGFQVSALGPSVPAFDGETVVCLPSPHWIAAAA